MFMSCRFPLQPRHVDGVLYVDFYGISTVNIPLVLVLVSCSCNLENREREEESGGGGAGSVGSSSTLYFCSNWFVLHRSPSSSIHNS